MDCVNTDSSIPVCLLLDSRDSPAKKQPRYELSKELKQWIGEDEANKKGWNELLQGVTNNNSVSLSTCVRIHMCVCVLAYP